MKFFRDRVYQLSGDKIKEHFNHQDILVWIIPTKDVIDHVTTEKQSSIQCKVITHKQEFRHFIRIETTDNKSIYREIYGWLSYETTLTFDKTPEYVLEKLLQWILNDDKFNMDGIEVTVRDNDLDDMLH